MKAMPAMLRDAAISACGLFRYTLLRTWDKSRPVLLFVMLNPSTADGKVDDRTIARCIGFAMSLGFGGIEVVNLYAFRATDPRDLRRAGFPIGADTDAFITSAATRAVQSGGKVCVAWGSVLPKEAADRPRVVLQLLRAAGAQPMCLRRTRDGHPQHPLYLPGTCTLQPFEEATS